MGAKSFSVEFVDPTSDGGAKTARDFATGLLGSETAAGRNLVQNPGFFFTGKSFFDVRTRDVRYALLSENEERLAMLPVEIGPEPHLPGRFFRIYQHPTKLSGTGVIAPEDRLPDVMRAVLAALRQNWPDALGFSLVGLDRESPLYAALCENLRLDLRLEREAKVQFYIDLAEYRDADAYLASRSNNYRRGLKRAIKKLDEAGGFTITTEGPDGPWSFSEFRAMDQKTWRAREKEGETPRRMLEMCERIAELAESPQDREMYALEMMGRPVALYFTLSQAGVKYGFKNTFDPDFSEFSPGIVAFHHLIETALERGLSRVELLSGSEYIGRWANRHRLLSDDIVFFPTVRGRSAYLAAKTARRLRDLLKDQSAKTGAVGQTPATAQRGQGVKE